MVEDKGFLYKVFDEKTKLCDANVDELIEKLEKKLQLQSKEVAEIENIFFLLDVNSKFEKKRKSEICVASKSGWFICVFE